MNTEMKQKHVVILGGGYAGVNAALRLRVRNNEVRISVINERPEFVERIRNHQIAAGERLPVRPLQEVLGKSIAFIPARAEKIDTLARQVLMRNDAGITAVPYDVLIYALGSGAVAKNTAGMHHINAREDAEKLKADLSLRQNDGVLVLGAGLTGLELATELRGEYPQRKIILADRNPPGKRLSPKAQDYLNQTLADMHIGFEMLASDPFTDSELAARWAREKLFVVNCTGFNSPELGKNSGLQCDEKGRVLVNEYLQAKGHENIFVAGDAGAYGFGSEEIAYAGCATASPMGTYVGEVVTKLLAGEDLPTFHYGFTFQCISLGRKRGIIQFLDKRSGKPTARVMTGKSAAIFKEMICKMTVTLPRWERKTRWPFYTWRKTRLLKRIGKFAAKAA